MAPGDSTPPTPEDAIQQGLDAPASTGADDTGAPPADGQGWQQQLIATLRGLTTAVQDFQHRQSDQPPKSEKLQPAQRLNDMLPLPQNEEPEHQPEPELPDGAEEVPITFEETATASSPSGFQQQQVAGAVNMGQGMNGGAAALAQLQAALQAQQQSNQQTLSLLQTMAAMLGQLTQVQQKYAHDLEGVQQQIEGLKAIIESLYEEMQAGQQRNPQNSKGNP